MVKRIQLQERDKAILRHVIRYRMTTHRVLHREFFAEQGGDAVTSTLRRLRKAELIESDDLEPPRRVYYHLTAKAASSYGLPASYGKSLGEQALPTRYGVLSFCCSETGSRHLMTAEEFEEEFPECYSSGLPVEPYYLDSENGAPRLALISVDLGADAGRIIRKCRKFFGERMKHEAFRELIQEDAFSVTILTANPRKKDAILAAKKRAKDFSHPIRVAVVPELEGVT